MSSRRLDAIRTVGSGSRAASSAVLRQQEGASLVDYMIAGLGNPGKEHAWQRHNVGAWCVNRLARRTSVELKASRKASTAQAEIEGRKVLLVRPRTFMNQSGEAIGPLLRRERLPVERLIVIYDELDLETGRIRLRQKGGSGGHNGLKSIIAAAGGSDFGRIRVGIGRPRDNGVPTWDPDIVMRHVLGNPPPQEKALLDESVERTCEAIAAILRVGWDRAMDVFNQAQPQAVAEGASVQPKDGNDRPAAANSRSKASDSEGEMEGRSGLI